MGEAIHRVNDCAWIARILKVNKSDLCVLDDVVENGHHPRVSTVYSAYDAKGMQNVRFGLGRRIRLTRMRVESACDCSLKQVLLSSSMPFTSPLRTYHSELRSRRAARAEGGSLAGADWWMTLTKNDPHLRSV